MALTRAHCLADEADDKEHRSVREVAIRVHNGCQHEPRHKESGEHAQEEDVQLEDEGMHADDNCPHMGD